MGLDAVGPGGLDQRVKVGARLGTADTVVEQPVLAPDHDCPVILPISGRKSEFITDGIRYTGVMSRCAAANSAAQAQVESSTLKPRPA